MQCNQANIEDNEYTIFSHGDLVFEHDVLRKASAKKEAFVQNQIVARSITNVTPQQLEGYTETFKHFDVDSTNSLARGEFQAALRAEGIYFPENEFEKIFLKAAKGSHTLSFQNYIAFMVEREEDKTTPEQLHQAFSALAHERDYVTESDLRMGALGPGVLEYFREAMPKKADFDGYDYKACKFCF